jgi:hypothetical protein
MEEHSRTATVLDTVMRALLDLLSAVRSTLQALQENPVGAVTLLALSAFALVAYVSRHRR